MKRADKGKRAKVEPKPKVKRSQIRSAQRFIGYEALTESGVCVLGAGKYSLLLQLSDINYQLESEDTQANIIEQWARLWNSFESSQHIQLLVMNRFLDKEAVRAEVELAPRGDGFDDDRNAVNSIVREKLERGRNNTITEKFLLLTVEAEHYDDAVSLLNRLEVEVVSQLRDVGACQGTRVSGEGWVRLLQRITRPSAPQIFTYDALVGSDLTTKDYVAPIFVDLSFQDSAVLGGRADTHFQVLCLRDVPTWLNDRLVRDLTDVNMDLMLSFHVDPIDQFQGVEMVKRQLAGMNMQRANEARKLAKQKLSEDLMPHELQVAHEQADLLLRELETSNEKLFTATILVGVRGSSREHLQENVSAVQRIARKHSCSLEALKYMQEDAFNAVLPLGINRLPISRTFTTSAVAILVPFTSQEIMVPGGIYYGVNALSKNLLVGDRRALMNGNAFYLGTTGSGKSHFAKMEIAQILLDHPDDDVIIIDPEHEYATLARRWGASTVNISVNAQQIINPLELDRSLEVDGSPVKMKTEFVLSLAEVLIGGTTGLKAAHRSILDRAANTMYSAFLADKRAAQPTLRTLWDTLKAMGDIPAHEVADMLELYAVGTFSGFARPTNVNLSNRFTVYDTSNLGDELKTFGMLIVLEQIWQQVARNRAAKKRTWVYVDEFHLYFANPFAAQYFQMMWKRFRKWGALATGITQNIEELLMSDHARLMLANSAMVALLNQTSTDADALESLFGFSERQREYFVNQPAGNGLIKMGSAVVPFDAQMAVDNPLYAVFSTKFGEMERV